MKILKIFGVTETATREGFATGETRSAVDFKHLQSETKKAVLTNKQMICNILGDNEFYFFFLDLIGDRQKLS